jgi:hypothetical protein
MVNLVMTKAQYKLYSKVIYNSKYLGNSWFNSEVKKMIYLGDVKQEKELRDTHSDLMEMANRYECEE